MSRKKLLILASTYPRWLDDPEPGFVHELAKRLTTRFEVRVLCPHTRHAATQETLDNVEVVRYRYAPTRFETLVNDGGIVNNLKHQPWKWLLVPFFLLGLFWRTWHEIRHWHPDVIHAHWLLPQGLIVALLSLLDRRAPPFLATSHGADLFTLRAWPLTALKRFIAQRATALTVVSEVMKKELTCIGISPQKICVRPMGVDLAQRFTPKLDLPRSSNEILFVGRLVEKKGLRYLLAAMPEIITHCPSAFLTVVGFGPEESERRTQAETLGITDKIHFLGAMSQAELPDLYRRAAVFVAPFVRAESGDQEGLGLVLIEALGCGCPVVVGDLEATADLFEPDEMDLRVSATKIMVLARCIITILKQPETARRNAERMRVRLLQRFSWDTVAGQYEQILQAITAQKEN